MPCGTLSSGALNTKTVETYGLSSSDTKTWSANSTQATDGETLVSTGRCTPGYAKKVRTGQLIPYTNWNQMEFKVLLCPTLPGKWFKTGYGGDGFSDWNISGDWGSSESKIVYAQPRYSTDEQLADVMPDLRYLLNQAAASAYSSNSYDLGTFIGELPETFQSLAKTVQRFKDIKDRKFKKLRNFDPHSFLLEARYGWSPLYRDIKSLEKQLSKQRKAINRVVGRSQATANKQFSWSVSASDNLRTNQYSFTEDVEISVMASVAADYVSSAWKLNPVATGYELIPYSFVVDWFWNLSQAIRASSLLLGASAMTACGGYKITSTKTFAFQTSGLNGCVVSPNPSGTRVSSCAVTARWPSSVPYIPPLQVRLDGNKVADLVAMISQLKAVKAFGKAVKAT